MERDIEKDLLEIEYAIKCHTKRDNMFTVSVLQRCHKLVSQLKKYKDSEEQGKLLKLPCAVDSEVWYIDIYGYLQEEIIRGVVEGYLWYRSCGFALNVVWDKPIMGHFGYKRKEIPFCEIGKTVFLSQEEAEAALNKSGESMSSN